MINKSEFAARRQKLLDSLENDVVCVIPAAREVTRSRDTEFPFRQDSDFLYLCGFNEPDAILLLEKYQGNSLALLFCRERDPVAEIWQGRRLGPERAVEVLGVDKAFPLAEFDQELFARLTGKTRLVFAQGADNALDNRLFEALAALRNTPKRGFNVPNLMQDIRPNLHALRHIKSEAELSLMRRAADISCQAHIRAMRFCQPGRFEYQLEAELHHEFAMQGARYPAYGTIVGSGVNGCILHYTENADELKAGDLVLIDAGAELEGYAADITRTFPVDGRFNPAQAQLYQFVLDAQMAAFEHIRPGGTLPDAMDAAVRVLTQGLIQLGILSGELEDNINSQSYRAYFMHGIGHWLGLDVHDVGDYKRDGENLPLEAGMVLTIEPGLYISEEADVDAKWRGIGIRIEDNLLVTVGGHENLTAACPKQIAEIEALMAKQ
ncbi:Xaa-Pro aminopeptidase [Bowmanella sp. Y26]|uniref:Xaa-Pro aminopeptidase n=1 Tax=Bowmanella yangjiangensis TaxID=2811230 RepID=UPI001BDC0D8E|nr:Xaa-Pro aminopeptidase [Bowmanella yangjiangensis]MBT1064745.1 Xaa-Pro aminopeptidase [Bowmanella yangjiangensis]